MEFYYNPLDINCKNIRGGVREGQPFRLRLFCRDERTKWYVSPEESDANAYFRLGKDGEEKTAFPMTKTEYGYTIELAIEERGLYFYTFYIEHRGFFVYDSRHNGRFSAYEDGEYQFTVSSTDFETPAWLKGGVMYQIFPDRFCRADIDIKVSAENEPVLEGRILREDWGGMPSYRPNENGKVLNNDFFGGNLRGIEKRLPYLKSLGVTAIYLNPIFEATSNHRYDTSDYMKIDPFLGTEEDFSSLVEAAKSAGIRLILDGVFNHTGDNSLYFNKYGKFPSVGAYQSQNSPYYSWYNFQRFPDKYSSWWGIDILPEVNEKSADYQDFIFGEHRREYPKVNSADGKAEKSGATERGVLKKWLSFGIGGYRLDVADELPDFFLKKLRKCVKETNKNALIIGEVWEDASNKISYSSRREYLHGEELDSVMNYPFKDAIVTFIKDGNSNYFAETVAKIVDHYPKSTLDCLMNILGTHDTARILTVLAGKTACSKDEMASERAMLSIGERAIAIKKLKIAALLLFTIPGIPCVYYGDEIGMEGFGDPFCRKCFDFENANEDLLTFYRRLGEIRGEYRKIFAEGEYEEVFEKDGCLVFRRRIAEKAVYVCVNMSTEKFYLSIPKSASGNNLLTKQKMPESISLQQGDYYLFYTENSM